jgi:hypothetical protein
MLIAATFVALANPDISKSGASDPVTIIDYTDPGQSLPWTNRSYWTQPWRSYMDTVPASKLIDALGINFNVEGKQAASTARLLEESGFTRARIEFNWGNLTYDDPDQLDPNFRKTLVAKLSALREHGLRPLIVLNANHGNPCPSKPVTLSLLTPADAGDTQIHIDPASIEPGEIVIGKTGIRSNNVAANHIFTSMEENGVVHISKPLKTALPAGPLPASTLLYEPFSPRTLPDGSPNPRFTQTIHGWREFVRVVTTEARSILGSDEFDLEVWNETGFGSNFLNINNYYEPKLEPSGTENQAILRSTVEYVRDPDSNLPDVQIGNGFANQSPHGRGLYDTALDKHPYAGLARFPIDKDKHPSRPLDGLGQPAGIQDLNGVWHDSFTPTFKAYFPEYPLSAIQPETLIRDLAPYITSSMGNDPGGEEHGRMAIAPGSERPSPVWVTEVNLPPGRGTTAIGEMSAADMAHIEAKTILRYLVAYVNKGVSVIDFYAAHDGEFSLINNDFFKAINNAPQTYPGGSLGGETMAATRRLTEAMRGAQEIDSPRNISLQSLTDYSSNVQFEGNGTAAYPPLYNRDVLAFLPFQVTDHRFVIPTYVMTRDVTENYNWGSADPSRFDLPAESYGLDIGGIDGVGAQVEALDPITGNTTPVKVNDVGTEHLAVTMEVTDSPRLLIIRELGDVEQPEEQSAPGETEEPERPSEPNERGEELHPPLESQSRNPAQSVTVAPTAEQDTDEAPPRITLRLGSRRTVLQKHRLTVRTRCNRPCRVAIHGSIKIGAKKLRIPSAAGASGLQRPGISTAINLVLNTRVTRLVRDALAARRPVSITVSATATTGPSASARRTLLIS